MTPEERDMLHDMNEKVEKIHREFFDEPAGGGDSFFTNLKRMADAYGKAGWLGRLSLWGVLTVGGIVAAWDKIAAFFKGT